uniref:Homeobox domain-containing protein n=1 Tax=Rhabditophanes sp. KR3021 TaxID=114890 RepID=A0AC35U4C6_9BILA
MCIALVLLLNTFYKMYYWLFDLCEHILAMTILLLFLLIITIGSFTLTASSNNQSRPLLTIAILVFGVAGGLAVVITTVYFYRLCLKRKTPITTTTKPEQKRAQVRSLDSSQCRPLTVAHPQYIQIPGQQFKSVLNAPQMIPQLTLSKPLSDDESYQNSCMSNKMEYNNISNVPSTTQIPLFTPSVAKIDICTDDIHDMEKFGDDNYTNINQSNNYLTIDQNDSNMRTQSADILINIETSDEIRRSSTGSMYHFSNPRPATRRLLPSTRHLENISYQMYNPPTELQNRRNSFLLRADALNIRDQPLKQHSSPLPEPRERIYSRQHAFSYSWNADDAYHNSNRTFDIPERHYPMKHEKMLPIPQTPLPLNRYYLPPTNSNNFSHSRQIKSMEERKVNNYSMNGYGVHESYTDNISNSGRSFSRPDKLHTTQHALSEFDKRKLTRQMTVQHLLPETSASKQCLQLWKERRLLEVDPDFLNNLSTDISDENSISTSFESNSESPAKIQKDHKSPSKQRPTEAANSKRQKFKNIMVRRQITAGHLDNSSFDSSSEIVDFAKTNERHNRPKNFSNLQNRRDFSIDSKTDKLFRHFSKNDPNYENPNSGLSYQSGFFSNNVSNYKQSRHKSMDSKFKQKSYEMSY